MPDLVFLDTETTSLHPDTGEVWEFAGIRVSAGAPDWIVNFQIECDLSNADPFALSIGKYRERFGKNGDWQPYSITDGFGSEVSQSPFPQNGEVVSKYDASRVIERFTRGAHVVGNVISFDTERLAKLLREEGETPGWHYHVIDIEPILVGFLTADNLPPIELPWNSEHLSAAAGVALPDETERHTALGDAKWVQRQWQAVFGA